MKNNKVLHIGYFADGPWAHRELDTIINNHYMKVEFICLRYNNTDQYLNSSAFYNSIPVFIEKNVNSQEFLDILKTFEVDLFVSMSFNQIFKENHFTISRKMEGPDHLSSQELNELEEMIDAIRIVELALGSNGKRVSNSERKNISIARKSIVAKRKRVKGELLIEENITAKRLETGISKREWTKAINFYATDNFKEDVLIRI